MGIVHIILFILGSSCDGISGLNIHRPFTNVEAFDITLSNTDYIEKVSNESSEFEEEHSLRPHPHFWLFMQITEESVFVYWHRRYKYLSIHEHGLVYTCTCMIFVCAYVTVCMCV